MEYKNFKTEAIVLGEKEFGAQDKIFSVFTKKYGKIEVLAKSIRKIKAKLQGGLQVLNHLSLEFIKGRNFNIATDIIVKNEFLDIKHSSIKFRAAYYISHLLNTLVKEEEKDERVWDLILETLYNIEFTPLSKDSSKQINYNLQLTLRYFEWNLLSCLGFRPEVYYCVNCQEKLQEGKFYFSSKEGGILCQKCKIKKDEILSKGPKTNVKEISRDTIKILRLILSENKKILNRIKIDPPILKELKNLSRNFIQYIAEEHLSVVL